MGDDDRIVAVDPSPSGRSRGRGPALLPTVSSSLIKLNEDEYVIPDSWPSHTSLSFNYVIHHSEIHGKNELVRNFIACTPWKDSDPVRFDAKIVGLIYFFPTKNTAFGWFFPYDRTEVAAHGGDAGEGRTAVVRHRWARAQKQKGGRSWDWIYPRFNIIDNFSDRIYDTPYGPTVRYRLEIECHRIHAWLETFDFSTIFCLCC